MPDFDPRRHCPGNKAIVLSQWQLLGHGTRCFSTSKPAPLFQFSDTSILDSPIFPFYSYLTQIYFPLRCVMFLFFYCRFDVFWQRVPANAFRTIGMG